MVNEPTHFTDYSSTVIDIVCTDAVVKALEVYNVSRLNTPWSTLRSI